MTLLPPVLTIRREQSGDEAAIHAVERAAFGREDEALLVDRLRGQVNPFLSFVACAPDQVIAHALWTPVRVIGVEPWAALGLGPVAVLPAWQRQGVGDALIRHSLAFCKAEGFEAAFVLGHPAYYPRFGFRPARPLGFACQWEVPEDAFMALALVPDALAGRQGLVRYHPAFDGV